MEFASWGFLPRQYDIKLFSESDFRSGSRNLSHLQQSFSGHCWLKGTRVDLAECWANIGQVYAVAPSRFYEENKPGAERELGKEECTHGNWCPFLESPETFRVFFEWHFVLILFVSSKQRRLEARNFAVIWIFIPFTTYEKTSFTEWTSRSFMNGFLGPKSLRDFRESGPWTEKAEDKKNYLPSSWTRPGWTGVKSLQLWSRPAWHIQQYHNWVRPFRPQVHVYPSSLYSTWESFLTAFKRNSHVFNVRIPPQAASIPARTDCPKRRKRWFYTIDYSWFIVQSLALPNLLQFSGGATKLVIGRPKVRLLLGALGFFRSFSESSSYREKFVRRFHTARNQVWKGQPIVSRMNILT